MTLNSRLATRIVHIIAKAPQLAELSIALTFKKRPVFSLMLQVKEISLQLVWQPTNYHI